MSALVSPVIAQSADESAEIARKAAKADLHEESITAFRRAIATAPDRRSEWLLELADQLTWSKQLNESIPLYREAAKAKDLDRKRLARRGLARALSWDGQHAAALVQYDLVLAMSPGDQEVRLARAEVVSWARQEEEELVEPARKAAKLNRHAESIDAYQMAIKAKPHRRNDWLLEVADQLTWADRSSEAIPLYRELVASKSPVVERSARRGLARALSWDGQHKESLEEYDRLLKTMPEDREIRLARAQVLSWNDQLKPALAEYEAVLRDHPDDIDALRGIGRVQSWRGRHRKAVTLMKSLLEKHPHDREATMILAESYKWRGKPDEAERLLREQTAVDIGDSWAAAMLRDLKRDRRPFVQFDWRESHQSDDVRTSVFSLFSETSLSEGAGSLGLRYDLGTYDPELGPVDEIVVQRAGLMARHRINEAVDWQGGLFLNDIDTRGASGDHEILTYETFLTLRPNDLLRFDIGSSRWIFDSQEALREGLSATQGSISMDVLPDELTKFSGRFAFAGYSDGNERTWWQFETERRIWKDPNLVLGYRYTGFDFAESWQSGYYSPDLYHSNELLVRSWGWFGDGVRWQLGSSIGYEHERPGDSRLIWSAGGSVAWEISNQIELEIGYDYSSSSATSANGFDRGTVRLSLRYTF